MNQKLKDHSKRSIQINHSTYQIYDVTTLEQEGFDIRHLPFSIKVLLESVLRQCDGSVITEEHVRSLADWSVNQKKDKEVPFKPARVILQDFTGVPAIVDLASMRAAMEKAGGDVQIINPEVPVDLVIDHSVQVDCYGKDTALKENVTLEFERNEERYRFLNWAQGAFQNLQVVPPSTGIVHQVNLEYLAHVVMQKVEEDGVLLYPDTLVGTDSHTTMINGLGVLGWGVGGIEAEAGMLGQPSYFPIPEVIGVKLTGSLQPGVTATDLALRITRLLRQRGVVGKFIEYFGDGVKQLPLADRATIANMAPEYGATCGYFPVDAETLRYLILTGRSDEDVAIVETYCRQSGLFQTYEEDYPTYSEVIDLDLKTVFPALAGPKRPQDLIPLDGMKQQFIQSVTAPFGHQGYGLNEAEWKKEVPVRLKDGKTCILETGSIVIASITSCTNTSNPFVMFGAGLLAKNAVKIGLKVPNHVKTSLAPGSKAVSAYLEQADLQKYLDELGFQVVGYGCATCIGNSGPLPIEIEDAIIDHELLVSSVLSGNRNFEGRIHPLVKANYLASPILVLAYALAGTVKIDFSNEPIGTGKDGKAVYLKEIWPDSSEIQNYMVKYVKPKLFQSEYKNVWKKNKLWNEISVNNSPLYEFKSDSTYIKNPPYFDNTHESAGTIEPVRDLRVLAKFGDSVTTDHISPAGSIGKNTPAGSYLTQNGILYQDFNTYGSRRGNHEVMMRGTFANVRIRNHIAPGTEGGYTTYWPEQEVMTIYEACMKYREDGTGLIILAGKDYGMGSSRDWAAKGPALLGVKVVIAESYERIHRSNLVMMGVLPLQFLDGQSAETLGLTGEEVLSVEINDDVKTNDIIHVIAQSSDGTKTDFMAVVRFDSEIEKDYYRYGGILQMVLQRRK